jgi:TolB-like protein/DNA-binding winged helix-turn-helix (wHTH) protein/Flp pilus assembly protein TadD
MTSPVRFGNDDVRLSGRQLLVGGQPVHIGARAFDVLSLLMKHQERVVTKEELLEAAWPGLVVEENNLHVQINTLRKVLGRDAITTVPGQGYQFTASWDTESGTRSDLGSRGITPQTELSAGQPSAAAGTPVDAPAPKPRSAFLRRGAWLALVLATLLAIGFGQWRLLGPRPKAETSASPGTNPGIIGIGVEQLLGSRPQAETSAPPGGSPAKAVDHSIAVLPFVDMSEKKDLEYFCDGLSEELLDLLSRDPQLHVASRTSAFSIKYKSVDLPTIARMLGVANVLEGSVRRSGNELRISAQLVRADDGYQLWSQSYDRKLGDIFQIQDEIASSAVRALHLSLLGESLPRSTSSKSMEAYTLYLQAQSLLMHIRTKADWEKVDEYAHRAISGDATFALAWAFFSRVLSAEAQLGYIASASGWEAARQAAVRSLALDPALLEGHAAMAGILIRHDWNWAAAQKQIDWVLQQDPDNTFAMGWAGYLAQALGHQDRAIAFYQNAIASDPLDPDKYNLLAQGLYLKGRFGEAQMVLREALALNSGQPLVHWTLARIAIASGDPAAALAELDREPYEQMRLVGRAVVFHAQGRKAESDASLGELEHKYAEHAAVDIAIVHAYRGEIDQAFVWLDRGYQQRDSDCVFVKLDPLLENIRADPRYQAFLRKMKLPA